MEVLGVRMNSFWTNKRVLVTGHTGFKGSWLTLWLNKLGAQVYGISLEPNTNPSLFNQINLKSKIHHQIININDLKELKNSVEEISPQIIFHLAAQPLVRKSYEEPLKTWQTNLMGTLNLLESSKYFKNTCAVVLVTTDKVYKNKNLDFGYRENDELGGKDPYSASKAACELAIDSWRNSFCGSKSNQNSYLAISSARSGNVIGGGDWAEDRLIPDAVRALQKNKKIKIRNPLSTRPWQHVLEPLSGYLVLAEKLYTKQLSIKNNMINPYAEAYNFGPYLSSNKTVKELIEHVLKDWDGTWLDARDKNQPEESLKLHLQIDKSFHQLGWEPLWSFEETISRTIKWYKEVQTNQLSALKCCIKDIEDYEKSLFS